MSWGWGLGVSLLAHVGREGPLPISSWGLYYCREVGEVRAVLMETEHAWSQM